MNPLLKLALEIGPLAVFFVAFTMLKDGDGGAQLEALIWATGFFMVALAAAMGVTYALTRTVSKMAAITGVIVLVMGGLTIWLQDETFIKYRPTVVNGLLASVLAFGLWHGESYLKLVLGELLPMEDEGWRKLTVNWAMFFAFMATLNAVVVELTWDDTETWVWVKTFVYLPLTLVFALAQTPLMTRYAIEEGGDDPASS